MYEDCLHWGPNKISTGGLTVALAPALRELDLKLLGMQWDTSSLVSSCPEYKCY